MMVQHLSTRPPPEHNIRSVCSAAKRGLRCARGQQQVQKFSRPNNTVFLCNLQFSICWTASLQRCEHMYWFYHLGFPVVSYAVPNQHKISSVAVVNINNFIIQCNQKILLYLDSMREVLIHLKLRPESYSPPQIPALSHTIQKIF